MLTHSRLRLELSLGAGKKSRQVRGLQAAEGGGGDSAQMSPPSPAPRPEAPQTSLQGWKCLGSL